ncbi:MAG: hypothetical protein ACTSRP_20070 [Candidatus Helarchaeota archaeon]
MRRQKKAKDIIPITYINLKNLTPLKMLKQKCNELFKIHAKSLEIGIAGGKAHVKERLPKNIQGVRRSTIA